MRYDPATITWEDTERLVKKVAGEINYPDREEVEAEARLAFVIAYKTYNPVYAKFSTWLTIITRRRLLQLAAAKSKHNRYLKKVVGLEYDPSCEDRTEDWTEKLSPDAKAAIEITLEFSTKNSLPKGVMAIRRMIKETLTKKGWSDKRIKRIFQEIKEIVP